MKVSDLLGLANKVGFIGQIVLKPELEEVIFRHRILDGIPDRVFNSFRIYPHHHILEPLDQQVLCMIWGAVLV